MITKKDVSIIKKSAIPGTRLIGAYTFLRDMAKDLDDDKGIEVRTSDATEAKKIQSRWRAYFKGQAHSRKKVSDDGRVIVYLWLEK